MIRVGFVFSWGDTWLGGVSYLRNLLSALYSLPYRKVEVVIFTGLKAPEINFNGLPNVKIVRNRIFDTGSWLWKIRQSVLKRSGRDYLFEWLLKLYGVSVISHSDWLPGNSHFPTIGWIPDFQHIHLPKFFSPDEIESRDKYFHDICKYCSTIILSSFNAQSDLERFDPDCVSKSVVLQFVVGTNSANTVLPSREELELKYEFTGQYFLLPNQFWKHKNHRLVIEALGILHGEGKEVVVLATGNTADYRHPKYFQCLMEYAQELRVLNGFRYIGMVPNTDLVGLMRESLAIINPSFFEGWSTTVEEAKALGKQILLSDIAVHREQNPPFANYFQPEDASALAEILWEVWNMPHSSNAEIVARERCVAESRVAEYAKQYQQIALRAFRNR